MICLVFWLLPPGTATNFRGEKKPEKKEETHVMTQAELQAQVMAFADRFVAIIPPGIGAYQEQAPPPKNYKSVFNMAVYSMASAFTIAAGSNPVGALLDMVAMITLGRIVFEENFQKNSVPNLNRKTSTG